MKLASSIATQLLFALALTSASAYETPDQRGQLAHTTPDELVNVGLDSKLGQQVDQSLSFTNEAGKVVTLEEVFTGSKPVFLSVVYFSCPHLCNLHLDGVLRAFNGMDGFRPGRDFKYVAISMNHRETPADAARFKEKYFKLYKGETNPDDWVFLVGNEQNVKAITDQVGFRFKWIDSTQEYSHASVAYVLSPKGTLTRALAGVEFDPKTLKMALLEGGQGNVGTWVDQFMMFCFQFDPNKNKYVLYAYNLVRLGAAGVLIVMLILLVPLWFRERQGVS